MYLRDIVDDLGKRKLRDITDFEWKRNMRFYGNIRDEGSKLITHQFSFLFILSPGDKTDFLLLNNVKEWINYFNVSCCDI